MASQNLFRALPKCVKLSQRAISTSAVRSAYTSDVIPSSIHLPDKEKAVNYHYKFGARERVGYGMMGEAHYVDVQEYPCAGIRFREDTPEVLMLREKEKGDWHDLTIDEIKTLYRSNFCQTYEEFTAPQGDWKGILADVFIWTALTLLYTVWMDQTENQPMRNEDPEWRSAAVEHKLIHRTGQIYGISQWFDYEKGKFSPDTPHLFWHKKNY